MKINGTEVQMSHDETTTVSQLYGHIHFHGTEHAQIIAAKWIADATDADAKTRREEAVRALELLA